MTTLPTCVPRLELQIERDAALAPTVQMPEDEQFQIWAGAVLADAEVGSRLAAVAQVEVSLSIVGVPRMRELNAQYRDIHRSTNVLSFPDGLCLGDECQMLGDIVICPAVVVAEAVEQDKSEPAHWAHMLVHGVLHLLGYEHLDEPGAASMEAAEIRILSGLGFDNPYTSAIAEGG